LKGSKKIGEGTKKTMDLGEKPQELLKKQDKKSTSKVTGTNPELSGTL
jgi:hypothetical protein